MPAVVGMVGIHAAAQVFRKANPSTPPAKLERARRYAAAQRKRLGRKGRIAARAYNKTYRAKNKRRLTKNARLYQQRNALRIQLRRKGIALVDYQMIVARQGNCCAICDRAPGGRWGKYVIDHDHKTNRMRGLLCNACNTALGLFLDDPRLLASAARYLRRA
jgi:hypothetical protein